MRTLEEIERKNKPICTYKVKPFPGKFPTRWKMSFGRGRKREEYCGKPNGEMFRSWIKRLKKAQFGSLFLMEFDRLGIVRQVSYLKMRGRKDIIPGGTDYPRQRYYNWFGDNLAAHQVKTPLYPKKIKFAGKIYTLYSTAEILRSADVFEFKRWINDNGVLG